MNNETPDQRVSDHMGLEQVRETRPIPQYSLGKILGVWAAAAIPMGILGWIVAPALAHDPAKPGFERLAVLTVGLAWQFVLVMILLFREEGKLNWATIKHRLWLTRPRSPKTGEPRRRLWLWLIPLILLTALYELQVSGMLSHLWVSVFPFLSEPSGFSLGSALDSPEDKAQMVGAWGVLALFIINAIFNTIIGEELLFRGVLLPRMNGVFGKWDWVANGVLFGIYHLHQPWSIFSSAISGAFFFAFCTRRFRSTWFGIIAHSGQSVYIAFLLLGLVLGLA